MFVVFAARAVRVIFLTSSRVAAAKTKVISSATWTPFRIPKREINRPPAIGAMTTGTRLKIDCNVAHRPTLLRQRIDNHREDCRGRHALPRHHQRECEEKK